MALTAPVKDVCFVYNNISLSTLHICMAYRSGVVANLCPSGENAISNTVPVVKVRVISQEAVSQNSTLPSYRGSKLVNAAANQTLSGEKATSLTPRSSSKWGLTGLQPGVSQKSTEPVIPVDSEPRLLPDASKPPEGIKAMLFKPFAVSII